MEGTSKKKIIKTLLTSSMGDNIESAKDWNMGKSRV